MTDTAMADEKARASAWFRDLRDRIVGIGREQLFCFAPQRFNLMERFDGVGSL